jgi:hypothetical protein
MHFSEKSQRPPIVQRGHIQNAETPLQGRGCEAGKQGILDEKIWVGGGGSDHPCEIPDGGEDFRRKGTNHMNITNI